ncbi:MAG: hypothetical protein JNJ54_09905 [Myxococcaceae bacterium]|nr:hypothetical protein [Myxococcaceae bacterium]
MTHRRRVVGTFDELLEPFSEHVNARCFARTLVADFEGLARVLAPRAEAAGGLLELSASLLRGLQGVDSGAVTTLLADVERLEALGRNPQLNALTRYRRDTRGLAFPVDVYSFHVDRAPVEADTFLCTYAGAPSEGLDSEDAERLIDDPAIRAALRCHHGRDEDFDAFLTDGNFDLHFRAKAGAQPFSFGLGHLWRIAVAAPDAKAPACIHRAPPEQGRPRLMLIS